MFGLNEFAVALKFIIIIVYGLSFFVSILFTFFAQTYDRMNDALKLDVFYSKAMTPLEKNIYSLDHWLEENRLLTGSILSMLSLIDINQLFKVVDLL